MCGIAGILNLTGLVPPSQEQITVMISTLRHRGPDECGTYRDERIALGHLRLSIIGIDGGTQPICNENGSLWIVYNGEAFNYIELKEDLLKKGHCFTTATDTEVLLHLYEEYGVDCLEKINGQFSLAIWDSFKKELFLARDRVGIRPLYYTHSAGRLVFASEIKAILPVTGIRELDLEALSQVFTFWTTLAGRTSFKNIHELPPGHYLLVKDNRTIIKPYWRIPFHPQPAQESRSLSETAEELRELLMDAVRLRLRADVPVGAYLSGGLDSSIIAMLISKNFNTQLKTFSMGFQEHRFDETPYQEELISFLGVDHRQVMIDTEQIREFFPETIWHCEKPLLRTSPVPMYLLANLVRREGFKVVLSGEGADEILGGYNIFKEAKVRDYWGRQPGSTRRPLLLERLYPYIFNNSSCGRKFLHGFFSVKPDEVGDPFFSHHIRWNNSRKNLTFFADEARAALASYNPLEEMARHLPPDFYDRDLVNRAQVLEMEIFLTNYLLSSQGDRVSMAHSVESRHPFLDYRVIDLSFSIPSKWKIRGLNEKYILKQAFRGMLPQRIVQRDKQPYRAPIRELFSPHDNGSYVDDLLSEESLKRSGYFNPTKVRHLFGKYRQSEQGFTSEFNNMALVGVLSTQLLHRQFVEGVSMHQVEQVQPDKDISVVGHPT